MIDGRQWTRRNVKTRKTLFFNKFRQRFRVITKEEGGGL